MAVVEEIKTMFVTLLVYIITVCTTVVYTCSSFGLTVSEAKTAINYLMCLETKSGGKVSFTINAAGQVYKQTIQFVYLGGAIMQTETLALK